MGQPQSDKHIPFLSARADTGEECAYRAYGTGVRRYVRVAFALSGAAALVYEVVWTRQLSLVFGSTVYAVSLMLAAFMTGLSLGSWFGARRADRHPSPLSLFGKLEMGVGALALFSIPLIAQAPAAYFVAYDNLRGSMPVVFGVQLAISYAIMLAPTTLMGATFPVVARINTPAPGLPAAGAGGAYSANTLGSIAGSLSAGFLLVPLIGVRYTTVLAAVLNLAVGASMIALANKRLDRGSGAVLSVFAAALIVALLVPDSATSLTMELYRSDSVATLREFLQLKRDTRTLFYRDAAEGPVAVLKLPGGALQLRNSGATEGAQGVADVRTTELLAIMPAAAHPGPDSMLVIGLGTGMTTSKALDLAEVRHVDTVEINPAVVGASTYFVGDRLKTDGRSNVITADARTFLGTARRRWDIVTSEPSYPLSTHVTPLFTREFFEIEASRLEDDGVICQWLPAYLLEQREQLMMLKTFREVFPHAYLFGVAGADGTPSDLFAIARKDGADVNVGELLAEVGRNGGAGFGVRLLAGPQALAEMTASSRIPLNTDDKPLLEFRAPFGHAAKLWRQD